jgi:hypothetical protein
MICACGGTAGPTVPDVAVVLAPALVVVVVVVANVVVVAGRVVVVVRACGVADGRVVTVVSGAQVVVVAPYAGLMPTLNAHVRNRPPIRAVRGQRFVMCVSEFLLVGFPLELPGA